MNLSHFHIFIYLKSTYSIVVISAMLLYRPSLKYVFPSINVFLLLFLLISLNFNRPYTNITVYVLTYLLKLISEIQKSNILSAYYKDQKVSLEKGKHYRDTVYNRATVAVIFIFTTEAFRNSNSLICN